MLTPKSITYEMMRMYLRYLKDAWMAGHNGSILLQSLNPAHTL